MSSINQKQRLIQNYTILAVECFCIILSFILGVLTRGAEESFYNFSKSYIAIIAYILFFHLLSYYLFDWNVNIFKRGYYVELVAVCKYNLVLIFFLSFFLYISKLANDFSRLMFGYFFCYNILLTYLGHLLLKKYFISIYRTSSSSNKMFLITTSAYAEEITRKLSDTTEWSFEITGIALMDQETAGSCIQTIPIIAGVSDLFEQFKTKVVDEVFIHLPDYSKEGIEELIINFESMGITVHVNIDYFNNVIAHKTTEVFAGFTVLSYEASTFDYRRLFVKRIIDIFGSLVGLMITVVLTPFIALVIKLDSKGPVFFAQKRVGKNGRHFKLYKFRSMYIDAEERKQELMAQNEIDGPMFKVEHDPRITKVGALLRKTSLDELPQFYNILIGNMSLVGTRPPTVDEFNQYELYYRRRLSIKPGLTGLWQISGRSNITDFKEVVKLDLEYIDNWSLTSDIRILLMTIWVVVMKKGAR
ncbi:MAG: sugar transferase [Lachnospiraceae bacterium]|jgi:exopolysaccharide biosynthesis polyprenyl glycosylphosphotransferase|nr:sugar transferase [Lachnospiraceae bacterium]